MLALLGATAWALHDKLPDIASAARNTHPRWRLVAIASVVTLLAYALLIECWRRVLAELGGTLRFVEACVVWLGSNLARYIPGAFWQIGAMGAMAQGRGVPLPATTAASMLITLVNAFTGLVVMFGGMALLALAPGDAFTLKPLSKLVLGAGALALALSPLVVPRAARIASRVTGRDIVLPRFTMRSLAIAGVATTAAWLAYGVAFWVLARAVLPAGSPRPLVACITLYTASYLAGWFNPAPAGIGAAESALVLLAPQLGVASPVEALLLAGFVRAWRTVLEVVPSVIALGAERSVPHRAG